MRACALSDTAGELGYRYRLSVAGCLKAYNPDGVDDYASDLWRWRRADNLRDFLPAKLQLFYNRWRSLKPPAST